MSISRLGRKLSLHEDLYTKRFLKYGTSPQYSGYSCPAEMADTFGGVARLMKVNAWKKMHSILDIGCGTGQFYKYLLQLSSIQNVPQRFFQYAYRGIDINEKALYQATMTYGEHFQHQDLWSFRPPIWFDYVVCTGLLGLDTPLEPWIRKIVSLPQETAIVQIFMKHSFLQTMSKEEQFFIVPQNAQVVSVRQHETSLIWCLRPIPL